MKFSDPKPPREVLFLALFLEQLPLNPYKVTRRLNKSESHGLASTQRFQILQLIWVKTNERLW